MKKSVVNPAEEKKPSIFWKAFKTILTLLFPVFKILYLNHLLKLAENTLGKEVKEPPYDWLRRQRMRNLLWGLGGSLPFLFSIFFSYQVLVSNEYVVRGYNAVEKEVKALKPKEAYKKYNIAMQLPSVKEDIAAAGYSILFGFFSSLMIGSILVYRHPLTKNTALLRAQLEKARIIREEDNHIVLATEVGFLIDITGSISREVADADRIWTSLNVRVNRDVAEHPEKRSLVFFKKAFELKSGGAYGFTKPPASN